MRPDDLKGGAVASDAAVAINLDFEIVPTCISGFSEQNAILAWIVWQELRQFSAKVHGHTGYALFYTEVSFSRVPKCATCVDLADKIYH